MHVIVKLMKIQIYFLKNHKHIQKNNIKFIDIDEKILKNQTTQETSFKMQVIIIIPLRLQILEIDK